jgi:hypothetical protein
VIGVLVVAGYRPRAPRGRPRLVAEIGALAAALGLALGGCTAGTTGSASRSPAASGPSSAATTAGASLARAVSEAVPSYYAETTASRSPAYDSPDNITVRVTSTGAALAMMRPPAPYQSFGYVYATDSPDVWIAGAQRWHPVDQDDSAQPTTLFEVTFSPATRKLTLARLPAPAVPGRDLAAAALSPDGTRLAVATLTPPGGGSGPQAGDVWLSVYSLASPATAVAARELATIPGPTVAADYALTWLDDDRTVALGGPFGATPKAGAPNPAGVVYADGASAGLEVIKTVDLSFPPGQASLDPATAPPRTCAEPPMATSDGRLVICGGTAATTQNFGPALNVGVWVFSAKTGKLTSTWDRHITCCAITVYPGVLWASPNGGTVVAAGLNQANEGAVLYIRDPDGHLRQIPWPGLFNDPDAPVTIVEPWVAW